MNIPDFLSSGEVARLIPVTVDGNKETRAASILLATLSTVPAFQKIMLEAIGQRVGVRTNVESYTEIVFKKNRNLNKLRPDGLIVLKSGSGRIWNCLVECKIKNECLDQAQVEKYITLAKENNINAVLTISNQFASLPTHSPLTLPKSLTKGIGIFHWSWMYALTNAMLVLNEDKFENNGQKYVLSEMTRYFNHPAIGVSRFDRMNSEWKDVINKIQSSTLLSKGELAVENTIGAWHQESRDICLLMSRKLNRSVQLKLNRSHSENPLERIKDACEELTTNYKLQCTFDIPDTAAPMVITADLLRRSVSISMTVLAPKDKQKTSSKVNWMLKQLNKSNPECLHIKAIWPGRCPASQVPLTVLRENPETIHNDNKSISPTSFEIIHIRDLAGMFSGSKKFIEQLESAVLAFYEEVGQHLRVYVVPPPSINDRDKITLNSTDVSEQIQHNTLGEQLIDIPQQEMEIYETDTKNIPKSIK